ncbi:hypothetical protein EYB26_006217 [Talaromyces marneffei]|uniref:uncharacterized protein n=1 Tax=Talaromyces marneffei TaxID=37727 RepID=UPI0012AAA584|nr:uncharacterized protein EYB26_006217 [Talaromyces marneffei]QGA18532.1 hypothetical protein EYB26_006217 [Talaromyces marneffei]
MLFKSVLSWLAASFMLNVYAAVVKDPHSSPSQIADYMDLAALTKIPTDIHPLYNTTVVTALNSTLTKRYNFHDAPFICHSTDFGYAEVKHVVKGIEHLTTNIQGQPSNLPLSCGRVSCSNNAAIWWCNLSNQPLTLDSFVDIASGASYIQWKCSIWDDGRSKEMVAGEANSGSDWSVVVRKNSC